LNITCSCENGLAPTVWPAGSLPGHGENLTNIVFDGARVFRSNMAVAIKSLEKFVGARAHSAHCPGARPPSSSAAPVHLCTRERRHGHEVTPFNTPLCVLTRGSLIGAFGPMPRMSTTRTGTVET